MSKDKSSKPQMEDKIKVDRGRRRLYDRTGATPPDTAPSADAVSPQDASSRSRAKVLDRARGIVDRYSFFSSGTAVLPVPLLDMAYLGGVQLKMLSELSRLYGVKFRRHRGKALIASLVSGLAAHRFTSTAVPWMLRYLPVVGFLAAPASMVFFSSALTWAVGRVFIQHFEAGGTLLDFDPEAMNDYFMERFRGKYNAAK